MAAAARGGEPQAAVDVLMADIEERLRTQLRLERTNLLSAMSDSASTRADAPPPPIVFLVKGDEAPTSCPTCGRVFALERMAIHARCCGRLQAQPAAALLQAQEQANAIRARARARLAGAPAVVDGLVLTKLSPRRATNRPLGSNPERAATATAELRPGAPEAARRAAASCEHGGSRVAPLLIMDPRTSAGAGWEEEEEQQQQQEEEAAAEEEQEAAAEAAAAEGGGGVGRSAHQRARAEVPELARSRELVPPSLNLHASWDASWALEEGEGDEAEMQGLIPCETCGRRFNRTALAKHAPICATSKSPAASRGSFGVMQRGAGSPSRLERLRRQTERDLNGASAAAVSASPVKMRKASSNERKPIATNLAGGSVGRGGSGISRDEMARSSTVPAKRSPEKMRSGLLPNAATSPGTDGAPAAAVSSDQPSSVGKVEGKVPKETEPELTCAAAAAAAPAAAAPAAAL